MLALWARYQLRAVGSSMKASHRATAGDDGTSPACAVDPPPDPLPDAGAGPGPGPGPGPELGSVPLPAPGRARATASQPSRSSPSFTARHQPLPGDDPSGGLSTP